MLNLDKRSIHDSFCHFCIAVAQHYVCQFAESLEFIGLDITEILLLKTKNKNRAVLEPEEKYRS